MSAVRRASNRVVTDSMLPPPCCDDRRWVLRNEILIY
jgi:hypothetical protein